MDSLTGDPSTDALLPYASALVWAVRTDDRGEVARILADVTADQPAGLAAFVVVLAALVPDDQSPGELLSWRLDPAEYLRLRTAGVDASVAATILRNRQTDRAA